MDEIDPFDLVGARIASARKGDAEAARQLIDEFCAAVRQNRVGGDLGGGPLARPVNGAPYHHTAFDERLLDYFAECFEKIGVSEKKRSVAMTADRALNLASNQRGRKKSSMTRQTQLDNGYAIHEAYKAATGKKWPPTLNKRGDSGPIWDAIRKAALERNISESTAARDYEEWQKLFRALKKDGSGTQS